MLRDRPGSTLSTAANQETTLRRLYGKERYCELISKEHSGVTPRTVCPSSRASGPSLLGDIPHKRRVSFVAACAGGDVQGTSSQTAWLHAYRMFKNGGNAPPVVGDVSMITRKVCEEVTRGSSMLLQLVSGSSSWFTPWS